MSLNRDCTVYVSNSTECLSENKDCHKGFSPQMEITMDSVITSTPRFESNTIPKLVVHLLMFAMVIMKTKRLLNCLRAHPDSPWPSPPLVMLLTLTISLTTLIMMPRTSSLSTSLNRSFHVIKSYTSDYLANHGVVHGETMVKALLLFETIANVYGAGFQIWVLKTRKELG